MQDQNGAFSAPQLVIPTPHPSEGRAASDAPRGAAALPSVVGARSGHDRP